MSAKDRIKDRTRLMLKSVRLAKDAIKAGLYEKAAEHCSGAAAHKQIIDLLEIAQREDEGEWLE